MFRANCNWLAQSTHKSFRFFHTKGETGAISRNLLDNQIKLIGRVKNEVNALSSGFKSFQISTAKKLPERLIGVTHSIKSRSDITETPFPNLTNNDLVYIVGEISYQRVKNGEKFVSVPHILARKVIRMESTDNLDEEHSIAESVNEVKLLGQISSEIHDGLGTAFSLVTNKNMASILKENHFTSDWHRISIFDDTLRDFVRNNLKITDRLLINGEIAYKRLNLEDGTTVSEARIEPTRIQKLNRLAKNDEADAKHTQATIEQTNQYL